MDEGFIPLGRSFFDHAFWSEDRPYSRAEAWLDLIQDAAYRPRKRMISGKMIDVPRGGIVAAERFLSDRWKWSRTKVRAFLDLLRSEGMATINHEKTTGCTVILLCNYERFNTVEKPPIGPPEDHGETGEEPNENKETMQQGEGARPLGLNACRAPDPDAAIPTLEEVIAYGRRVGVSMPREFCIKQHAKTSENHAWITAQGRLIDWQKRFFRFWQEDKATWQRKSGSNPLACRNVNVNHPDHKGY